jgi:hypothetical protein
MSADKLAEYLFSLRTVARIHINNRKHTVVIRVHADLVDETRMFLEPYQAVGILFEYKRMRLWDFWKCRNQLVVIG